MIRSFAVASSLLVAIEFFWPDARLGEYVDEGGKRLAPLYISLLAVLIGYGTSLVIQQLLQIRAAGKTEGIKTAQDVLDDRARRARLDTLRTRLGALTVICIGLCGWTIVTGKTDLLPLELVPSPTETFRALQENWSAFGWATAFTSARLIGSVGLAGLLAAVLGISMGQWKRLEYFLPVIHAISPMPPIVLVPIFMHLFSPRFLRPMVGEAAFSTIPSSLREELMPFAVVAFGAFWPIFMAALNSSQKTPENLLQVASSAGASSTRRLKDVVLPHTLPAIFVNARVSLVVAFIVLLSVEAINVTVSRAGLGHWVRLFYDDMSAPPFFALILLAVTVIYALNKCLDVAHRRLAPWAFDADDDDTGLPPMLQTQDGACLVSRQATDTLIGLRTHQPDETVIELNRIHKAFGNLQVLTVDDRVTFRAGELVSLIGESGNGKTTLSRIIAGYEDPDPLEDSSLNVAGVTMFSGGRRVCEHVTPGVSYLFQELALFPHLTVVDNIRYPLLYRHLGRERISDLAEAALAIVGLSPKRDRFPHLLSGGEKQRVALARALVCDNPVLILDEALSAIDQPTKSDLRFAIKRLTKELNLATIYISHDREDILQISDRVIYLKSGRIVQDDSPKDVYYGAKSAEMALFMGHRNVFRTQKRDGRVLHVTMLSGSGSTYRLPIQGLEGSDAISLICVPKNWIDPALEMDEPSMRFEASVVGEARFSGTEVEFEICTSDGLRLEVVLQDDEFSRFIAAKPTSTKLFFVVRNICNILPR